MRQKSFFISIIMTLFILGVTAGIVRAVNTLSAPIPEAATAQAAPLGQTFLEREAQYNQTITEANQRLEKANQALQQMQTQLTTQQAAAQPSTFASGNPAPDSPVTVEKASQIALTATNGWADLLPEISELVDYQGKAAYQIKLSNGGSIFVDHQNGEVVFNTLTNSAKNVITEDDASKAAVTYLKGGGVFKVERTVFNEQPAYRVIFDVGHRIYVSLGGDILYVELYKIVASGGGGGGGGGSTAAPRSHESEHEDSGDND